MEVKGQMGLNIVYYVPWLQMCQKVTDDNYDLH